jgi:hypothetical protein
VYLEEAKVILEECERFEIKDAAGDTEVFWINDDELVADGFFTPEKSGIWFIEYDELTHDELIIASFLGDEAHILGECGTLKFIAPNDLIKE